MTLSTDLKDSIAAVPSGQGIYIDLFNNFKQVVRNRLVPGDAGLVASDDCNDCDCECAPQCPDCGPSLCG